ncbi:4-phosphopantetheinyl transferase family protein, partial [Streptomyces sp. me109]
MDPEHGGRQPQQCLTVRQRPCGRALGTVPARRAAHTAQRAVFAQQPPGHRGQRRPSFDLLHPYVCTPAEAAELAALPEDERTVRLLHLWTLKEAYTKALGHGM